MDEFGVLTERYGIKPQGKSAPMAASKRPLGGGRGVNPKSTWNNKVSGNESDDIFFTSSSSGFKDFDVPNTKSSSFNINDDDLMFSTNFGSSSEMKKTSSSSSSASAQGLGFGFDDVDLFGASSKTSVNDDIFGSFSTKQDDDLLGGFGLESNTWNQSGFDGLIPGFGASSHTTTSKTTTASSDDDPFVVLESTTSSGLFVDDEDIEPDINIPTLRQAPRTRSGTRGVTASFNKAIEVLLIKSNINTKLEAITNRMDQFTITGGEANKDEAYVIQVGPKDDDNIWSILPHKGMVSLFVITPK